MMESSSESVKKRKERQFLLEEGDKIKGLRLQPGTRYNYSVRQKKWLYWMVEHFPEAVDNIDNSNSSNAEPRINLDRVTNDMMEVYLRHTYLKVDKTTGTYFDPPKFYSLQHVNGYVSAIKDMYRTEKKKLSDEMSMMLKDSIDDYKKKVATLRESGEMPISEGKQPMTFEGYVYLAKKAVNVQEDFSSGGMCWVFLLLCWNLIARAVTVSNITYEAISWKGDALTIFVGKMKNDQRGERGFPRHIFANPNKPFICPVLALSVFIFTKGFQNVSYNGRLLFGERASQRFTDWLRKAMRNSAEAILAMGLIVSDLGSHSFRKGVASSLSDSPGGPTAISIWLRAGWSLGNVQSRYIFQGAGGDQFAGRAATGFEFKVSNSKEIPDFSGRSAPKS